MKPIIGKPYQIAPEWFVGLKAERSNCPPAPPQPAKPRGFRARLEYLLGDEEAE